MSFVNIILNLFFPPRCVFCNEVIAWIPKLPDKCICDVCRKDIISIVEPTCIYCGRMFDIAHKCEHKSQNLYYDRVICVYVYTGVVKKAIRNFKFHGKQSLCTFFGDVIRDRLVASNAHFDIIVGVPMYKDKIKKRGYNQADLLAKEVSNLMNKDAIFNQFVRVRNTQSQYKVSKDIKKFNIVGAFDVINKGIFVDKRVLLVDDIFTTGATVNECAKVLKDNGAKEVIVVTIACGK